MNINWKVLYKKMMTDIPVYHHLAMQQKPVTLESSIFPFKSITLKGILKAITLGIIIYFFKTLLYPIIIEHITDNLFQVCTIFSLLTYLLSSSLNESLDYIIKDTNFDSLKKIKIKSVEKDLTNSMEKGESSKMGEKAGESSKSGESSKRGRIISDSDYESDSDSSPRKRFNSNPEPSDSDPKESRGSKLVNSNLPEFKENLERLTNEEIVETMDVIDCMKEEYKKSGVPSAKSELEKLSIKEDLCARQLEENFKEDNNSKGKGKEVDRSESPKYKGKGKEIDRG